MLRPRLNQRIWLRLSSVFESRRISFLKIFLVRIISIYSIYLYFKILCSFVGLPNANVIVFHDVVQTRRVLAVNTSYITHRRCFGVMRCVERLLSGFENVNIYYWAENNGIRNKSIIRPWGYAKCKQSLN